MAKNQIMKSPELQPNISNQCEFGYDQEKASCIVHLPNGKTLELIQTTFEEPSKRDGIIRGFCPKKNAMGEVHLIEEFGKLSVKKVLVDSETLFEAPTYH